MRAFAEDVAVFIGIVGLTTAPIWIPYWFKLLLDLGVIT